MDSPQRTFRNLFFFISCFFTLEVHSQDDALKPIDYFTQQEIDEANTAKDVGYLTNEEKDIYLYTNLVRLFPQKFYEMYVAFVKADGKESLLKSNSYYTSLTKNLKSQEPLVAVFPNEQMFKLAECWAIESGEKGLTGHDREDCEKGQDGENCAYGLSKGQSIVMKLLIDYGIQNLGHRKNLLHPDWVGMGAAIRPHSEFRIGAVQDFSRTNDLIQNEKEKRVQNFSAVIEGWDKREFKSADINRKAKYLNDLEKDFYLYVNLMRVNPRKFKADIWDKGPYLDQASTSQEKVQATAEYKMISKWLESTEPLDPIEPDQKVVSSLQCFINGFLANKSNSNSCFIGLSGSSRLRSFYVESSYDGTMGILLTPGDFEHIVVQEGAVALKDGDQNIIAFFQER